MGLSLFNRSCSRLERVIGDPNPGKFRIERATSVNGFTVAMIKYPDCTTYDGTKVCIFKCTPAELHKRTIIDPHFLGGPSMSGDPIARFPGSEKGWDNAIRTAEVLI